MSPREELIRLESDMNQMRFILLFALAVCASGTRSGADAFNITRHDAVASAAVQLFLDPLPPRIIFGHDRSTGPEDSVVGGSLSDSTPGGALGASVSASARSRYNLESDRLLILDGVHPYYLPSGFGGANPGGRAAASIASVVEFRVPVPELHFSAELNIEEEPPFAGEVFVRLENVTRGTVVLSTHEALRLSLENIFPGQVGDVVRMSAFMSGGGVAPPGIGIREFQAQVAVLFVIPEPGTVLLLGAGILSVAFQRRVRPARG
jgi:hypothetical protein